MKMKKQISQIFYKIFDRFAKSTTSDTGELFTHLQTTEGTKSQAAFQESL
jgi:hypothetical protein